MVDARTKIDIIYADVLGDVSALLDRIDKLKTDLPRASDGVIDNLNVHVKRLIAISSQLEVDINSAISQLHEHASLAAMNAKENTEVQVKKSVVEAIESSTTSLFTTKFLEMESKHTTEIKRLTIAINEARRILLSTIEEMKVERAWSFFYCFTGSAIATCSMGLIIKLIK